MNLANSCPLISSDVSGMFGLLEMNSGKSPKFKKGVMENSGAVAGRGLILLPFVFYPILGFGDATYQPKALAV